MGRYPSAISFVIQIPVGEQVLGWYGAVSEREHAGSVQKFVSYSTICTFYLG